VDVTAEAAAGPALDITGLPSWTLDEGQLGDLELLLMGAFAPLTGFLSAADVAWVAERGTLEDGTPWPVPVVLDVPEDAVPASAGKLTLNDPEGTPLAIMEIVERSAAQPLGQPGRPGRPDGTRGPTAQARPWPSSPGR
jgi:sulfate adenylyltransferase